MTNDSLAQMFGISTIALRKHFAYPNKWKKTTIANKRKNHTPISEENLEWLKANYPDMSNKDLAEHLGVGECTVANLAKKYGLKKSEEHRKLMLSVASKLSAKAITTVYHDEFSKMMTERWERERANGNPRWSGIHKPTEESTEEEKKRYEASCKKLSEGRKELFRKERQRIRWGMKQKTRLKVRLTPYPKNRAKVKWRMREQHNYFYDAEHPEWICYDKETRRSEAMEATARKYGLEIVGSEEV